MTPKFRYWRISFWAHWGWFLPLSLLLWKTEPVKETSQRTNKHEAGADLSGGEKAVGAACTHSIGAVRPRDRPVHHPGDSSLLASMCQHLAHGLTRRHTACGSQLLLYSPLLGWTGNHRDRRAAGEHLCGHMVLGARKLQPEKMVK